MVSTRKKRQSNGRLLSELDDFDRNVIIGNAMNKIQENTTVNESTAYQELTFGKFDSGPILNENVVNVKICEKCFNKKIDREMGNIVDTVEDKILTAIDCIITPKIELTPRSINASFGRDATSVIASSQRGEHIKMIGRLENISERSNTLHVLNINDETRNRIQDKVIELSVPDTHFDRQPQPHHSSAYRIS